MRGICSTGYSSVAPTEFAVLMQGRKVPDSTKRPMLISGGYGAIGDWAVVEQRLGGPQYADAGYAVLGGDFGGTNTFGNDTAQARIDEGWAYVKAQLPCATDKVILVGQSMGGMDMLNWAHSNLSKVAAIVLCHPAVDLEDIHDNNRSAAYHPGGFAVDIEAAYTDLAGYNAAKATHNPARYPADFAAIPILLQYSTNDAVCTPAAATAFATGAGASTYNAGAVFHSFGAFGATDIYNFVRAYA